jgi:hypothetical protein
VRRSAVDALSSLKVTEPQVITALIETLKDENNWVRSSAAKALGNLNNKEPQVITGLIKTLKDENNWVRSSAAKVLLPSVAKMVQPIIATATHQIVLSINGEGEETFNDQLIDGLSWNVIAKPGRLEFSPLWKNKSSGVDVCISIQDQKGKFSFGPGTFNSRYPYTSQAPAFPYTYPITITAFYP